MALGEVEFVGGFEVLDYRLLAAGAPELVGDVPVGAEADPGAAFAVEA